MPSIAKARTLTARMRKVRGEMRRRGCGGAASVHGGTRPRPVPAAGWLPVGSPGAAPTGSASGAAPAEGASGTAPAEGASGAVAVLAVAVAISDAIERLDLGEFAVDDLELLAQPLDVAVDRPVVDIDVLAIGRVHQLIAAFDMALARRQRFQNEELGDRELDRLAAPSAEMAPGIEHEVAAL